MTPLLKAVAVAVSVDRLLAVATRGRWERGNFRGRAVSLSAGPALVLAAIAAAPGWPAAVIGLGAGMTGLYDDAVGGRDRAKGLRGHAAALRAGRLTGGTVKVVGVGASALLGVRLLPRRPLPQLVTDVALVAGTGNLLNLLDLRPGRALKVGALLSAGLGRRGSAAAALTLLPADLAERSMLGDTGANGFGALLGLAAVERLDGRGRLVALAGVAALTAASERVSFTTVIERTPVLRALDGAGRLP